MNRFLFATSAAALLLGGAGCTMTAPTASGPTAAAPTSRKEDGGTEKRFKILDGNGDGKVTMAEFNVSFAKALLVQYDTDHDGTISLAEWRSVERAREDKVGAQFTMLDRNGDGKISEAELSHGTSRDTVVRERFSRLDLNHDGVITPMEARAFGIKRETDRDPANHV